MELILSPLSQSRNTCCLGVPCCLFSSFGSSTGTDVKSVKLFESDKVTYKIQKYWTLSDDPKWSPEVQIGRHLWCLSIKRENPKKLSLSVYCMSLSLKLLGQQKLRLNVWQAPHGFWYDFQSLLNCALKYYDWKYFPRVLDRDVTTFVFRNNLASSLIWNSVLIRLKRRYGNWYREITVLYLGSYSSQENKDINTASALYS